MEQVVKLTVYLTDLTDLADLDAFRQVRDEYTSTDRPPARSRQLLDGPAVVDQLLLRSLAELPVELRGDHFFDVGVQSRTSSRRAGTRGPYLAASRCSMSMPSSL
jgi:hypothetical protein